MSLGNDPYNPPIDFSSNPVRSTRPTSVTVLAIIGIILGGIGTICSPFGLLPYFFQMGPPDPLITGIKGDSLLFGWTVASTMIGWIMAIFLLAGSIGSLMLKEWARKLMLAYAWVGLVIGVISIALTFLLFLPRMRALIPPGSPALWGLYIGQAISVVALLFPLFVVIYFVKPHVKAAFAQDEMAI